MPMQVRLISKIIFRWRTHVMLLSTVIICWLGWWLGCWFFQHVSFALGLKKHYLTKNQNFVLFLYWRKKSIRLIY